MMRSMFSGVSGLRVHQTRMDVIGNNIANVNTIGFKSQRVTFNEVFSQTLQSASSASDETGRGGLNPMQVGLGVNVSSIDMLMTQGAAQRTDNPFDLMINGEGFIVVGDASGKYFTRAGALRQDAEGNLIIPNGMKVMGWTDVQTDPATGKEKIVASEVKPIKLNDPSIKTTAPVASSKLSISGNLKASDTSYPSQISFYDSLGNYYNLNVTFTRGTTTTSPVATPWTIAITPDPDLSDPTASPPVIVHTVTDQNGNKFVLSGGTLTDNTITFTEDGKPTGTSMMKIEGIELDDTGTPKPPGSKINDLTVDLSKITQYETSKSDLKPDTDGHAAGKMMGYSVGADGKITASYDTGEQRTLGQIVVAKFDNPAGLEKVGDNLFSATANSGDFDNIGKVGTFQAGVLEMSNVDLSKEFTDMIVTQRGFQANSRIISVSDEMLQELTNLKR